MSGFIWWILVGAAGGWLAGYVKNKDSKLDFGDVVVGVVGALVGGVVFTLVSPILSIGGLLGEVLSAFVGSMIVLWVFERYLRAR
ncbi:MAG: GlsB/YeaQ/YmgE family stress response membrane protein [Chloroflexi bacterium]|nr:GlsB/YeaQ/YmgE family stress response membrane protein [Chloroflexota bacterium]